jgi:hypothetical protein
VAEGYHQKRAELGAKARWPVLGVAYGSRATLPLRLLGKSCRQSRSQPVNDHKHVYQYPPQERWGQRSKPLPRPTSCQAKPPRTVRAYSRRRPERPASTAWDVAQTGSNLQDIFFYPLTASLANFTTSVPVVPPRSVSSKSPRNQRVSVPGGASSNTLTFVFFIWMRSAWVKECKPAFVAE